MFIRSIQSCQPLTTVADSVFVGSASVSLVKPWATMRAGPAGGMVGVVRGVAAEVTR